jgi:hypothetical protein
MEYALNINAGDVPIPWAEMIPHGNYMTKFAMMNFDI